MYQAMKDEGKDQLRRVTTRGVKAQNNIFIDMERENENECYKV